MKRPCAPRVSAVLRSVPDFPYPAAACELVEQLGATVLSALFAIELADLDGRARLRDRPCQSLLQL